MTLKELEQKDDTAWHIVCTLRHNNPERRFAVYEYEGKIEAVGFYSFPVYEYEGKVEAVGFYSKTARFIAVYGKSQSTGAWLDLPLGELVIDGKPVHKPENWKEIA